MRYRIGGFGQRIEHAPRGGPDARQQVQDAESGDAVARIFDEPEQRQHVLDMGCVQKFQAAEFDEGDVVAG